MTKNQGIFWIGITALIGAGMLLGEAGAVSVGALTAALLAYSGSSVRREPEFGLPTA